MVRHRRSISLAFPMLLGLALAASCGDRKDADGTGPSGSTVPVGSAAPSTGEALSADAATAAPSAPASASAAAKTPSGPALPDANTEGCPDGMVRVEGDYCPAVMQHCVEHHEEYENANGNKNVSERCMVYENPSRCVSKQRRPMAFCMDRFEYPNQVGELPRLLTDWHEAKRRCEEQGKRLCTEDEYNFACEGPEILPYVYGFERNDEICNIDKDYRFPDHSMQMKHYDACLKDDRCREELERLDQRHKIGDTMSCVSWAGIVDLNGNVNEWVELPGQDPPNRSGLKGGWWGPVRGRCRPTVTFHKENDYGYEVGFRCCSDPT